MSVKLPGPQQPKPEPPPPQILILINTSGSSITFTVSGVPNQPFVLFDASNNMTNSRGVSVPANSYEEFYFYGVVQVSATGGYWLTK